MLIEEFLIKEKIQLIVKDINFKLFNDDGEVTESADVVFSLFASFASSEMTKKKERFKRALKEYRKKGYSIGGKRLFGYDRVYVHSDVRAKPISMYRPNEKEKAEIIQIYKWYAHGIDNDLSKTSTRTITEKTNKIVTVETEGAEKSISSLLTRDDSINLTEKNSALKSLAIIKSTDRMKAEDDKKAQEVAPIIKETKNITYNYSYTSPRESSISELRRKDRIQAQRVALSR
jgi:hypothetical protein